MTFIEFTKLIENINCYPFEIKLEPSDTIPYDFTIIFSKIVKDPKTGKDILFQANPIIPSRMVGRMEEKEALSYLRAILHQAAIHEIDEQFLYKGEQIFDPHISQK